MTTINKSLQTFQAIDVLSPVGSLDAYISWVHRLPVLSVAEEQDLAVRFRQHGDLTAARQLVLANLRFVVKVARGFNGYGLGLGDLIQEGNIGLMKAVKRFDPKVGVRLVTFAVHWIRAEISEFVLRNWRIVKVATTKAQRKLFFNLRSASKKLSWLGADEVANVAEDLHVSAGDVRTMEGRMVAGGDVSFSGCGDDDADTGMHAVPEEYLEDADSNPSELFAASNATQNRADKLSQVLASLDARSRDILQQRWLTEPRATLEQLATQYNISAERVRQLERSALAKAKGLIGGDA